jgi:anti-sigma B factor antagonist
MRAAQPAMGSATFQQEDPNPETTVLAVKGELDVSNVRELRRRIDDVLDRRSGTLIIDLVELIHMDSSGLAELISANQRARLCGMRLVLAFDSPGLRRTIEVRGLDGMFTIADSRADALGTLEQA